MGFVFWIVVFAVILFLRVFIRNKMMKYIPTYPTRSPPDADPVFSSQFLFGVASSAFQVESNVPPSNWYIWSQRMNENGQPCCPDDRIKCDGFSRYLTDGELAQSIGCQVYRFSVSWSRLNPSPGHFDKDALLVYRSMCIKLKSLGIEPLVTLWHFEHPSWLEERGSVAGNEFVSKFSDFADFAV